MPTCGIILRLHGHQYDDDDGAQSLINHWVAVISVPLLVCRAHAICTHVLSNCTQTHARFHCLINLLFGIIQSNQLKAKLPLILFYSVDTWIQWEGGQWLVRIETIIWNTHFTKVTKIKCDSEKKTDLIIFIAVENWMALFCIVIFGFCIVSIICLLLSYLCVPRLCVCVCVTIQRIVHE